MGSAVLEMPKNVCAPCEIGTLGAFFQPSVTPETTLKRSDERLIRDLVSVLDRQLIAAVDTRSESEFSAVRDRVFFRYVRALRALDDTISNLIPPDLRREVSENATSELSSDLEKQESRLGPKLVEQSIFTLWTINKIRSLADEICAAGDVSATDKAADTILLNEYRGVSLWAQFHLDTVFAAMKFDMPVCEEIREPLCDGLRAAVNAYAVMKDALYLRRPMVEQSGANALPWDEEDDQLLDASMRDMNADLSDDV